uniref:Uncharacterized protein n=1 Tax=Anguilla anguilla TaxID=7936 RepID=A0A0E9TMV8_ANGAN
MAIRHSYIYIYRLRHPLQTQ